MKAGTLMGFMIMTASLVGVLAASIPAQTGEEILAKMDRNREYSTVVSKARMEIYVDDQVRTKSMEIKSMAKGKKSLVEFTNAEDIGTKYLKVADNLWIYFPSENDVVKISGHMLKEGMMGSDVSYEDALEADQLSRKYSVKVDGIDSIDGNACWVVTLEAKTKDAPYYRRKMWVDQGKHVAWKEELYAKSGRLLKESRILEIREIEGRHMPVKLEMVNKLRKNSKTVFVTESAAFNQSLSESLFTMRNLRR